MKENGPSCPNISRARRCAQLMQEHPEKKDEYLRLFVEIQLQVQSKTCPLLSRLKDKMNRKISQADLDATTRYDLHTRLEGMPKHNKVCHGDFRPSNVIISEDGTPYVIDWSARHSGQRLRRRGAYLPAASGSSGDHGGCGKVS